MSARDWFSYDNLFNPRSALMIAPSPLTATQRSVQEVPKQYLTLSKTQLDLMDRIREHANLTRDLTNEVQAFINAQPPETEPFTRVTEPMRALAIAQTELQTGYMWLSRAVAQPRFF